MGAAWKSQWSVGNSIIDSEHRNLLAMAGNLETVIGEGDIPAIVHELEQFEYWLCGHFENEEEIALAAGFDFAQNGQEHQNLLNEFHRMKEEFTSCGGALPGDAAKRYARFLDEWLIAHILEEDALMKPVLQARAYDFMPDYKVKPEASLLTRTWKDRFG